MTFCFYKGKELKEFSKENKFCYQPLFGEHKR
jgi:hypothetical protein